MGTSAVNVIGAFPKLIAGAPTGEVGQGSNFMEDRRFLQEITGIRPIQHDQSNLGCWIWGRIVVVPPREPSVRVVFFSTWDKFLYVNHSHQASIEIIAVKGLAERSSNNDKL